MIFPCFVLFIAPLLLLTTPGSQETGESFSGVTLQKNTTQFIREQRLDLPVTQLPPEIYSKVCASLDAEDPFFYDYRMLAEKFGVRNEQIHILRENQTDSLLIKYKPNVRAFMEILKTIERKDVMEVIEKWLNDSLLPSY